MSSMVLQVGGQVVQFLTGHLGYPVPSPTLFEKIGNRFCREVDRFAVGAGVPVLRQSGRDGVRPLAISRVVSSRWVRSSSATQLR